MAGIAVIFAILGTVYFTLCFRWGLKSIDLPSAQTEITLGDSGRRLYNSKQLASAHKAWKLADCKLCREPHYGEPCPWMALEARAKQPIMPASTIR